MRERKSGTKEDGVTLAIGDSGDGPGDGSVTDDESMVDIVVVGEESEDSDAKVEVLSRWTWKAAKGTFVEVEPLVMFPLEAGLARWEPWAAALLPAVWPGIVVLRTSSPKTDMNEGICAVLEPV